jgi:hypothetical protein
MEDIDLEARVREGGAMASETLFLGKLVMMKMLRIDYNEVRRETRDWLGVADTCSIEDTALNVCCIRCMWYSVYAVLGVRCTRCMLYSVYAVLGVCCIQFMLYSVLTDDHCKER